MTVLEIEEDRSARFEALYGAHRPSIAERGRSWDGSRRLAFPEILQEMVRNDIELEQAKAGARE